VKKTGINTYEVKVYYRAFKKIEIEEENHGKAHKKAYDFFMDSSPEETLEASSIDYSLVETSILGPEASDMLHD